MMSLKNKPASKNRLIYILSPSFSGSTLLTLLLAQHPRISTIGELKATSMGPVQNYSCSCGELITECGFWEDLKYKLQNQGIDFDLQDFGTHFCSDNKIWNKILNAQVRHPLFELIRKIFIDTIPGLREHYKCILNTNRLFMQASCELQNADYFLDGSKDPHRLLYMLQSNLWDIYVIRMYRNGLAQSNSHRRKFSPPPTFLEATKEWRKTIKHMENISRVIRPDRILTLKYEDLCASPRASMELCWEFLHLGGIDMDWNNVDLKQSPHHILGNQMRTRDRIQISLDEKWKLQVSEEEKIIFKKTAGRANHKLGYL